MDRRHFNLFVIALIGFGIVRPNLKAESGKAGFIIRDGWILNARDA
jgi:hypothetical protein